MTLLQPGLSGALNSEDLKIIHDPAVLSKHLVNSCALLEGEKKKEDCKTSVTHDNGHSGLSSFLLLNFLK